MTFTKSWSEIQLKIRPDQALQDLTVLELLIAMDLADKVIALAKWDIKIEVRQEIIHVTLPKEIEPQSFTDELRDRVIDELVEMGQAAFGDGQDEEYLRGGTEFVGYDNLADSELCEELEQYCGDSDLIEECKAQLEVTKMLEDK